MRNTFVAYIFALLMSVTAHAVSNTPDGLTFQGKIVRPNGTPLEAASIAMNIRILSPSNDCILLEENHMVPMNGTGGAFSIIIGGGTRTGADKAYSLLQVFKNPSSYTGLTCGSGTTYSALDGHSRKVRVAFDDGTETVTLTSDFVVRSVPYSTIAETVQGKGPADFIQANSTGTLVLTQAKAEQLFENTIFTELIKIIDGTTTQYSKKTDLPVAAGSLNMAAVGKDIIVRDVPTSGDSAVNKDYVLTTIAATAPAAHTHAAADIVSGVLASARIPTGTDDTKLPLAGGAMTGHLTMGGKNILATGHITMSPSTTINLGTYDDAAEDLLDNGLTGADKGKFWYNTDTNILKFWNGSAAVPLAAGGGGITSFNTATGAAQVLQLGTAGNSPAISRSGNTHTIDIPVATATATGVMNTGAGLVATAGEITPDFGTGIGKVVQGNDDRLAPAPVIGTALSYVRQNAGGTAYEARTPVQMVSDLGLGTMATGAAADYLDKAGNLSGLANTGTARTNLGLGTAATAASTDFLAAVVAGTAGNVLTSDGTNWTSAALPVATAAAKGVMQVGTGLAVSTGTVSADFGAVTGKIAQGDDARFNPAPAGGNVTDYVRVNAGGTGYETRTIAQVKSDLGVGTMGAEAAADYLSKAGNLSGLGNAGTARTNLGATATGDALFIAANAGAGRTALGLGTIATATATDYLDKAGNLSGLGNAGTARTNLGATATGDALFVATNAGAGRTALGLGTAATAASTDFLAAVVAGTAGNVLTSDGTNWTSAALPVATAAAKGVMQVGTGLSVTTGTVTPDFGSGIGKITQGNDDRLAPAPVIGDALKLVRVNAAGTGYEVVAPTGGGDVMSTLTLTAGTGLSGGGTLAANRTFTVDFGTGVGKVVEGNDDRLAPAPVIGNAGKFLKVNAGGTAYDLGTILGVTDGDKGDITVSSTGTAWGIDNGTVSLAKMADMATASLLGRNSGGSGAPEVLSAATAKTLLSLNNVENTAVSTWAGSANITTVGTIGTGSWNGTDVAVTAGGTGMSGGTSGGIPYYNSSTTMASSAELTQHAVILGGGAGAAPVAMGSLGTATHVLTSNGAGLAPTWQAIAGGGDFKKDGSVAMTGNIRLGGKYLSNDGNDEGVAVDDDGEVGIGTLSPGKLLHLYGASPVLKIERTANNSEMMIFKAESTNRSLEMNFRSSWNDAVYGALVGYEGHGGQPNNVSLTSGTAAFYVVGGDGSAGNRNKYGFGVNIPTKDIAISGEANVTLGMENEATAATAGRTLTINAGGSGANGNLNGGDLILASGSATGDGGSAIQFQTVALTQGTGTTARAATTKVTIAGNGNVGIGTSSPAGPLHVAAPAVTVASAASANAGTTGFVAPTITLTGTTAVTTEMYSHYFGPATITDASAVSVTSAANLYVSGPPVEAGSVALGTAVSLRISAGTASTATNGVGLFVDAPTGATNNYAAIFASGNVGIGTTAPTSKLHVAGDVTIGDQATRTTSTSRGQLSQSSTYITTSNTTGVSIDWNYGNIQELTTYLCNGTKTIAMSNMKDGAVYTLLVSGAAAHSGKCMFTGYTFKSSGAAAAPTASYDVLYTFVKINSTVIYTMMDALQ